MGRVSFRFRLNSAFILLIFVMLTATTFFVYQASITRQKSELRDRILGLVKLSGMMIDVNKLSQIKPQRSSEETDLYKEVRASLEDIRRIDPIIDSVYTMIKSGKENIWIFLVDSGDKRG